MIINKFRGDKTILDPGIEMLEEKVQIPVVGVTPYMNLELDDEDSLSEKFDRKTKKELVDIAVIRFPRISNFTDFNVFELIPNVSLRYVKTPGELGDPDMILLPGSKNTIEDLLWLRQSGLENMILKEAYRGTIIFGICGGYQMLGEVLSDPHHVETGGMVKGMGLLPIDTVFSKQKTRSRVKGRFLKLDGDLYPISGAPFEGYEIHMGISSQHGNAKPLTFF